MAGVATAEGRFETAVELLSRLHSLDPLAEDVVEASMRALYLSGRRDAALDLYRRFTEELEAELGLEPLATTRELLEQVSGNHPLSFERPDTAKAVAPRRDLRPSRLFGRDRERALLLAAATPAVLLAGEPGIGKSALLSEVYPDALFTAGREGLERMPYHPFAALLRSRPELTATSGAYLEDLARLVPELADVTPSPADPDTAKLRVAEALAQVVTAAGVPLVMDDLHWADPATLECLVYLTGRGLRVFGAYRDQEASPALLAALAGWRARGDATVVQLHAMDESGVRAFMADLMRTTDGPELFARRLWQRTGGNPMFLLETLRSLFDAGVLQADGDGWRTAIDDITVDYSELDVPPKVTAVIGRRLASLDGAAVRVLEALALAPVPLSATVLATITGLSVPATATALEAAEDAGFITDGSFRHDLLREATALRLSHNRKRVTHTLLAKAYAEESGESSDP
ncbi:MAG TPA: AAA family ATPase, partial [Trueperaceae bacterium]|nr:AAA family ATPase [Trueperaceae bacterium]